MSLDLARPDLLQFVPYSSARKEAAAAQIMLNANESPWPPFAGGDGLNRYPQPQPAELLERLARIYAVDPDQLLVGRGSDEAIDLLMRGFCRAGIDSVVISPPTFGMYRVSAQLQAAGIVEVPLLAEQGFAIDGPALIEAALAQQAKLVFICSPNNPTGQLAERSVILQVAEALAGRALVVVDEAYVEFAAAPSLNTEMAGRPNLLLLRTLSKAYGLAAARLGCLIGPAPIVHFLRGLMAPYPLPQPSVTVALQTLDPVNDSAREQHLAQILAERSRLAAQLATCPAVRKVWLSDANFLCVRWTDAAAVRTALASQGIIVRDLSRHPGLADCLRISVGTAAENGALLAALAGMDAGQQSLESTA